MRPYIRSINQQLHKRLQEKRQFIQVMFGPRQVGKTTAIKQVLGELDIPFHYISADQPAIRDHNWLEQQWEHARMLVNDRRQAILALDEIQKISGWSETVKKLWDEDSWNNRSLKVVLLGSSPLLIQKGLTESLAGRFEVIRVGHWSYQECREYFGWDLDTFIYHGSYPAAATMIKEPQRWIQYIQDSLIETTISRDIMLMTRVDKPALLRRLFHLSCEYSGQILSYRKMLGQLHEAGNTTTLAHYLELLDAVGFVAGLQKYSGRGVRRRASSPKLQVYDTALIAVQAQASFIEAKKDREFWGRLVESAVGAHLANLAFLKNFKLFYWREGDKEVDFVIQNGKKLIAVEVKSSSKSKHLSGMQAFDDLFAPSHKLLVGSDGIPIEQFLSSDLREWLS